MLEGKYFHVKLTNINVAWKIFVPAVDSSDVTALILLTVPLKKIKS